MKKLEISEDRVLDTIKLHPETRDVFESLFPSIVETELDRKPFIKIGQVFVRTDTNERNSYTIQIINNVLKVLNHSTGKYWESTKHIQWSERDRDIPLTIKDFNNLFGKLRGYHIKFVPIPYKLLTCYSASKTAKNFATVSDFSNERGDIRL